MCPFATHTTFSVHPTAHRQRCLCNLPRLCSAITSITRTLPRLLTRSSPGPRCPSTFPVKRCARSSNTCPQQIPRRFHEPPLLVLTWSLLLRVRHATCFQLCAIEQSNVELAPHSSKSTYSHKTYGSLDALACLLTFCSPLSKEKWSCSCRAPTTNATPPSLRKRLLHH